MHDAFIWRGADSNDIPGLIELGLLAYGEYAPFMTTENLTRMSTNIGNRDMWLGLLASARSFVCVHNNRIVGMAFLVPSGNPWDMFPAEWSYIRMVGVDPGYKGRGIARILMKQCVDHAKATNETVIALHTSERMHAARHIYEEMGFKILREIEPRLGMRYWVYTLELDKQPGDEDNTRA
jgi:ribosomal protein S18 acetylase RimI-like enzyme